MLQQYPNGEIMQLFENILEKYFTLPIRTTTETKIHWLQLQIIHKIIPCNISLFKSD